MITQYPWVSVRKQERKHIEIGAILTLTAAIISFYSIPDIGNTVVLEETYVPPEVEIVHIPVTVQPPEVAVPLKPTMVVEGGEDDMDPDLDIIPVGLLPAIDLTPPEPQDPTVPFWAVEVKPVPIGGWAMVNKNVVYPPIAIEARQEGRVVVEALIGKDGNVKDVKLLASMPGTGLDEAAIQAVYDTPFSPAYQRDKPVLVWVNIPIVFRLR